jgi:hypothetical protein
MSDRAWEQIQIKRKLGGCGIGFTEDDVGLAGFVSCVEENFSSVVLNKIALLYLLTYMMLRIMAC